MIIRSILLTSLLLRAAPLLAEKVDSNLRPLISKESISEKIREVASSIQRDYAGKDLVIVMVMKGSLCLVADLIREIDLPLDVEFIQCKSYGALGKQRGALQVIGLDRLEIEDRDLLVVDDVFDSGHTLAAVVEALKQKGPRSVKSLVLLSKAIPRTTTLSPDYALFPIGNEFVVGYGLDYKERYRGLDGIYILE